MLQPTHYLDFQIRDGNLCNELHARLLFIAHQLVSGEVSVPCAVDFPGYQRQHGLGFVMRVFGRADVLEAFQLKAMPLINVELLEAKPIRSVPTTVDRYVMCRSLQNVQMRSRSENPTPAWVRRETAYRTEKGLPGASEEAVRERWRKRALRSRVTRAPFIGMHSFQSQQDFRLYIDRRSVEGDAPVGAGKGYALGFVLPDLDQTGEAT